MRIVTTHTNTDFDGLAAMVAVTCLYPGTVGVLPSHVMPNVKAFMALHQELFKVMPRKELDPASVTSLAVVDANRWNRLDRMEALSHRSGLEISCWDHHMEGADIASRPTCRQEVGAAVTLLLEEMARLDTPFTPMHATLFLLGIYDDTGCLCYPSATPRDARMVAFLLENGADLNLVSAFLTDTMDASHSQVFSRMLDTCKVMELSGVTIGICAQPVKNGLTMLSSLVGRYKEFKGLDAVFGIFLTGLDKCMVIGRGDPKRVDVGAVVRELGGGGHPGAGSAVVKKTDLDTVIRRVEALVAGARCGEVRVKDIMSDIDRFVLDAGISLQEAARRMDKAQLSGMLVCDQDRFLGILPRTAVQKARDAGRMTASVKGFVKSSAPRVNVSENTRTALAEMNRSAEGLLPVFDRDHLTGVLTRGNLILHLYDM